MGKMQHTSLHRKATDAAASLPSTVARITGPPSRDPEARRTHRADRAPVRDHLDRMDRALLETRPAAGAAVVVEPVAQSRPELDHRVLGAGAQTAVAFDAVPARQAPASFEHGLLRRQRADHLIESAEPLFRGQLGLLAAGVIAEVPEVQKFEFGLRMLGSAARSARHAATRRSHARRVFRARRRPSRCAQRGPCRRRRTRPGSRSSARWRRAPSRRARTPRPACCA